MYILELKTGFSAAHRLVDYPGVCNNIHGHNWQVSIKVIAESVDDSGMSIDMVELEHILETVVAPYDHTTLNDQKPFNTLNPTSENVAKVFFKELLKKLPENLNLKEVKVQESDNFSVTFLE